jgi:hypothetical protein
LMSLFNAADCSCSSRRRRSSADSLWDDFMDV